MKFLSWYINFMSGRNGSDEYNRFLVKIYFVLVILNLFLKNQIIYFSALFIFVVLVLRFTSKNIKFRKKENSLYLKIVFFLASPYRNIKRNIEDKNNIYKKCHHCKTVLKLPLPDKIGFKKVKCPDCKKMNKFLILRRYKVEIIKNDRRMKHAKTSKKIR